MPLSPQIPIVGNLGKMVLTIRTPSKTFEEVHYCNLGSDNVDINTLPNTISRGQSLANAQRACLPLNCRLLGWEMSNTSAYRNIASSNYLQGFNPGVSTDNENAGNDCLKIRLTATSKYRRMLYLGAVPDDVVTSDIFVPGVAANWFTNLQTYLNTLAGAPAGAFSRRLSARRSRVYPLLGIGLYLDQCGFVPHRQHPVSDVEQHITGQSVLPVHGCGHQRFARRRGENLRILGEPGIADESALDRRFRGRSGICAPVLDVAADLRRRFHHAAWRDRAEEGENLPAIRFLGSSSARNKKSRQSGEHAAGTQEEKAEYRLPGLIFAAVVALKNP